MDLTREAIEKLGELHAEAFGLEEHGGFLYAPAPWTRLDTAEPEPDALKLTTLISLAEYLSENRDGLTPGECLVHVADPTTVYVRSVLRGPWAQRPTYVRVDADLPRLSFPGEWMDQERFSIALQAECAPDGDRAEVLKLAGNLKAEDVRTDADDGVTQDVTVRSGVTVVEQTEVPNPVELAPWRTFHEVDQPLSPFVFRVRRGPGGPQLALFDADGGAWRQKARHAVSQWLRGELADAWQVVS